MRKLLAVAALALTASASSAQEAADPRAVSSCQADGATFVQIAECIPDAHVAVKTLDAFDTLYSEQAAPLKTRCLELNEEKPAPSAVCVTSAISASLDLAKTLPEGTDLGDPVFDAVNDPVTFSSLQAEAAEARKLFPDKTFWGGTLYQKYQ